jgi:hypothetical protein
MGVGLAVHIHIRLPRLLSLVDVAPFSASQLFGRDRNLTRSTLTFLTLFNSTLPHHFVVEETSSS